MRTLFHWAYKLFFTSGKSSSSRYLRWVSHALIISVSLNIALLVTFIHRGLSDSSGYISKSKVSTADTERAANEVAADKIALLHNLAEMPFHELVPYLKNDRMIEDGLNLGDFALAALVTQYNFDVDRGLGRQHIPRVKLLLGNKEKNSIESWFFYPSITNNEKAELMHFAITEAYPFTTQGLLRRIRDHVNNEEDVHPDLLKTFLISREFLAFEEAFSGGSYKVTKKELLALILSGDEQTFFAVANQDFSPTRDLFAQQVDVVQRYLDQGSRPAVILLLRHDPSSLARNAAQNVLLTLLQEMKPSDPNGHVLALEVLTSPRGPEAWKGAATYLYRRLGKEVPEPFEHRQALKELVPRSFLKSKLEIAINDIPEQLTKDAGEPSIGRKPTEEKTEVFVSKEDKVDFALHKVEPGDSLWKLARKFNTDVQTLRQVNQLESDTLKVGQELKVP